jgi:hypothetical protein
MSKIGAIALVVVLTLVSGCSDTDSEGTASQERSSKITLLCSGTRLESPPVSLAFMIDQDQGIVTPLTADNKPGPPASISENTEGRISFKAVDPTNGEVVAEGVIDRYLGSGTLRVKGAIPMNLTCKPAKPLF